MEGDENWERSNNRKSNILHIAWSKNGPAHDPARRILGVYEGKYVNPKDPHALKDTRTAKRNEKAAKCWNVSQANEQAAA